MISTETHRHLIRERTRELAARTEPVRLHERRRPLRPRTTRRLLLRRRATRSAAGI